MAKRVIRCLQMTELFTTWLRIKSIYIVDQLYLQQNTKILLTLIKNQVI